MTKSQCFYKNQIQLFNDFMCIGTEYLVKCAELNFNFYKEMHQACGEFCKTTHESHNAKSHLNAGTELLSKVSEKAANHAQKIVSLTTEKIKAGEQAFNSNQKEEAPINEEQTQPEPQPQKNKKSKKS